MSAFIFVLILVTLAQYYAQNALVPLDPTDPLAEANFLRSRSRPPAVILTSLLPQLAGSNLIPLYRVSSDIVPDNSIEAQRNICPGFRSVWGEYFSISNTCQPVGSSGIYERLFAVTDDPAPAGSITTVALQYRDLDSCRQNGEVIQTTTNEVVSAVCTGPNTVVLTATPFPQDGASPLGLPIQVLKEVPEDSQLFARYSTFLVDSSSTNATCAPDFMYWYTTGECLKDFNANSAFVYTFDNFQFYNENFTRILNVLLQIQRLGVKVF